MRKFRWEFMAVAMCLAGAPALAGTPAVPAQVLASPGGGARATLVPQAQGAIVTVERRDGAAWRSAWQGELRNAQVADLRLDDDGRLLAFDEGSAEGEHAIALYDAEGRLVRELALTDFLPRAYVHALAQDASGLHWRNEAAIAAQDSVEFSVPVPAAGAGTPALQFSIDLHDGLVRTAQIREYLAAADAARTLAN